MDSESMNVWVFVLFLFAFTTEAVPQESCTTGIKTLAAKMDKLHADIKAIARGLNLLNPPGKVILFSLMWFKIKR